MECLFGSQEGEFQKQEILVSLRDLDRRGSSFHVLFETKGDTRDIAREIKSRLPKKARQRRSQQEEPSHSDG